MEREVGIGLADAASLDDSVGDPDRAGGGRIRRLFGKAIPRGGRRRGRCGFGGLRGRRVGPAGRQRESRKRGKGQNETASIQTHHRFLHSTLTLGDGLIFQRVKRQAKRAPLSQKDLSYWPPTRR